jgi:hypothetical protein
MPTSDLYIDIARGIFVTGRKNSTPISSFPPLVRGTTQSFRIMLLNPTGDTTGTIYTALAVTDQTIQMAIGQLGGSSYLTSQFTWSASSDPENPFYSALLPLNTPNITSAIGSSSQLACVMQIDRVDRGIPSPVILQDVTIRNAVIIDGTEVSAPGRTLLYAETASTLFLTRTIVGPVVWVCADDPTKKRQEFIDVDGSRVDEPTP